MRNLDFVIFKLFSDRFFSYYTLMAWNDWEPLPAVPGSLAQHSGSLLSIFGVAGGPYTSTGKLDFAIFKLFSDGFFSYHTVVP